MVAPNTQYAISAIWSSPRADNFDEVLKAEAPKGFSLVQSRYWFMQVMD